MEKRSQALDILRAMAILLILLRHLGPFPKGHSPIGTMLFHGGLGGWIGVDLFFVLSGFLISGLLFNEHKKHNSISFRHFFIRRGFKIYPPYFAMLLLTLLFALVTGSQISLFQLVPAIFFFQNYADTLLIWSYTWSLAVEEQFYIILPLILILLTKIKKDPFSAIPPIFFVIAITCLGLRIYNCLAMGGSNLFQFHLRADSLFFGVLLSYLYHYHPAKTKSISTRFQVVFLILGALLLVPPFFFQLETTLFIQSLGPTLLYIGSGLILMAMIHSPIPKNPLTNATAYLGKHSYPIYLWHFPIKFLFGPHFAHFNFPFMISASSYLGASILVGILMSNAVEYPMLRLRDRFWPSRSRPPI